MRQELYKINILVDDETGLTTVYLESSTGVTSSYPLQAGEFEHLYGQTHAEIEKRREAREWHQDCIPEIETPFQVISSEKIGLADIERLLR